MSNKLVVERFEFRAGSDVGIAWVESVIDDEGGYVSYADYADLAEEAASLRAQLAELRGKDRANPIKFKENTDADMCRYWAWEQVKKELATENWAAGEGLTFYGFFCWGWDMRRQYNEQRPVPPAASQPSYRDGIEAAANWIDTQREAYAQLEYSSTLAELSEGIRSLHPSAIQPYTVPYGYSLVPSTIYLDESDIESICSQCGDGGGNYGDFTRGILWVGNIQDDEGNITHGLHISSDDYPEEGGITLAKFAAAPQHKGD